MIFSYARPTQLWLEISSRLSAEAWEQSQHFSDTSSVWRGYLNQICYQVFFPWIQEEYAPNAAIWLTTSALPSVWEFVNGTVIVMGTKRLILLPTEIIDEDELRVPQEWVDIPSWVGDYYLAVQVNLHEKSLIIWGYTTHQQLKHEGRYDPRDRSYSLDGDDIFRDMRVLWVAQQLCSDEVTREVVASLPSLPMAQAENLIQRLASPNVVFPRLAVPFSLWGALLENENWRSRLYHQRLSALPSIPVLVNLSRWGQNIFADGWQSLADLSSSSTGLAYSFSSLRGDNSFEDDLVQGCRWIDLPSGESIALLVKLTTQADNRIMVRVQLHPRPGNRYLPANIKLILLSFSGKILQYVEAGSEDNYIQVPSFKCSSEFQFSVKVALQEFEITEYFVV
ncbi:DUF1822 family protein [Nostoc sp. FACHB-152]|uniref:DUF1822 family protein n=1 Tax=unclassified Nostoc TaxID=2593658 RepID=UPI001689E418|nr:MULTISPECIES: DUF1822 family protein [unclassified Nostoc]MBD2449120.1 DUF1822 family protein [Nostoc sp. FACHB-152]MBD2470376.1 DUF1822 family protein [Nostoc sp. FACHB-145]